MVEALIYFITYAFLAVVGLIALGIIFLIVTMILDHRARVMRHQLILAQLGWKEKYDEREKAKDKSNPGS